MTTSIESERPTRSVLSRGTGCRSRQHTVDSSGCEGKTRLPHDFHSVLVLFENPHGHCEAVSLHEADSVGGRFCPVIE
jgi:hypothetical protein